MFLLPDSDILFGKMKWIKQFLNENYMNRHLNRYLGKANISEIWGALLKEAGNNWVKY